MKISDTIIAFYYTPGEANKEASLLANNLAHWGDHFRYMLHWVFEPVPNRSKVLKRLKFNENFEVFQTPIPEDVASFPFGSKVIAAADAEALAENAHAPQLIWMDPDNLIIQPPVELLLDEKIKIAISPVHLTNISSRLDQAIDPFWKLVYSKCNASKKNIISVTSLADQQKLRAHFNAGLISVKPGTGILRKWRDNYLAFYQDPVFEEFYQADIRYKIFLHQAILTATILAECASGEIRILPKEYNFPIHLLDKMPPTIIPVRLNDLVTARYDDFDEPDWSTKLPVDEPYRSWLFDAVEKAGKIA